MPSITTRFRAKLFRMPGKGGWTFAPVPERHAPPVMHGWGRSTVVATVDGYEWKTSVCEEKSGGRCFLFRRLHERPRAMAIR